MCSLSVHVLEHLPNMLLTKGQKFFFHNHPSISDFFVTLFNTSLSFCPSFSLSCSCFFHLLSLFFECQLKIGGAALTCHLTDPVLFKSRLQFYRPAKQTAKSLYNASIINATWFLTAFWWILYKRRNPRVSLLVRVVLLHMHLIGFSLLTSRAFEVRALWFSNELPEETRSRESVISF